MPDSSSTAPVTLYMALSNLGGLSLTSSGNDVTRGSPCDVTVRGFPRVVVDVQYVDDDRSSVSVFLVENAVRQLITLVINK